MVIQLHTAPLAHAPLPHANTLTCSALLHALRRAPYDPTRSVLFADLCSFTSMCGVLAPGVVMSFLNALFSAWDDLVEAHGVYKVGRAEGPAACACVAGGRLHMWGVVGERG